MSKLLAVIDGNLIAQIDADKSGRLSLTYEREWAESAQGHSLSASMPLAQHEHPHKVVASYLWNLLPENPNVLERWAREYHVSAANPFKILMHVGADVPGAAQFLTQEQFEELQSERRRNVQWIEIEELTERLRQLRADIAAVRRPGDKGKMSLPGAQAKTAYYWDEQTGRWGIPLGRTPTTHIIKPCVPGFDGLVENEHLCQDIASRLGMAAALSKVLTLDQTYIVVERYDRLPLESHSSIMQRIHQEDMCQALGLMPAKKYQEDGGPGVAQIATLIRRVSSDPEGDVDRLLQANIFNWLIGGTDAHSKNYSLLIGAGDEFRLAPLYDLSSQLPYPGLIEQRVAMKIGDHYDISLIDIEDWNKLARACAVETEHLRELLNTMTSDLPDAISAARDHALSDGLARDIVLPLAEKLLDHVRDRVASISAVRRAPRRSRL
jgi:serine/threonine-protein kinase HipA